MLFGTIQPVSHWETFWRGFMNASVDPSTTVHGSTKAPDASLRSCVRPLLDLFLCFKDLTFRYVHLLYLYSRSAASSFVLDLSRFLLFLGQAARQDKIWWVFCNQRVGATIAFHSRVLHLALFVDSNKEIETNDLFLRQTGWSFVHPWVRFFKKI